MPLTVRDENGSNLLMLAYRWQNYKLAESLHNRKGLCEDKDVNRFHETAGLARKRYCHDCKVPSCA